MEKNNVCEGLDTVRLVRTGLTARLSPIWGPLDETFAFYMERMAVSALSGHGLRSPCF